MNISGTQNADFLLGYFIYLDKPYLIILPYATYFTLQQDLISKYMTTYYLVDLFTIKKNQNNMYDNNI